MIEDRRLYPVTILSQVTKNALDAMFKNDIVLAQDIADLPEEVFVKKSGLDPASARSLKRQADELCPCS